MSLRGFRDGLAAIVPKWLANRPGLKWGYSFLFAMAAELDGMMEGTLEGVESWWPGYGGRADNLAMHGRSRGLIQGEAESTQSFAARLIGWLQTWENAGSDQVLVREIQAYLGNTPMVRLVSRSAPGTGQWTTIAPDGTITQARAAWDWDSISNPERNQVLTPWWSDYWIIVYPCEWAITGSNLASLVPIWGTYNGVGTGHAVPRAAVDVILGLVAQWKGAHTFTRAIIYSYDATLFDPANPVAGDPDGTWGLYWKIVAGNVVTTRNNSARYWEPPNGG